MPRYTGWRRLAGDTDRPDLLDLGKRLLGYLEQQRANGAPKSLVIQRQAPDGSIVRARFVYDLPVIEVQAAVAASPAADQIDGFVVWPTAADGTTANADTPRVVLAGPAYRPFRKSRYGVAFPDVTDPVLGTVDGLGRAGTVDWQGRAGWVLSWYGPRNRYMDFGTVLKPWVFFKGQPLIDMRDYIDTDATVLGAAVASFASGQWLVIVSEDYDFARYERVSAIRLVGNPTDATASVVADSFTVLDSRSHNDANDGCHPWFFAPDGKEARMVTRDESNTLYERVIALGKGGSTTGFSVARANNILTRPTQTSVSGYTAGVYARHPVKETIVLDRRYTGDVTTLSAGTHSFDVYTTAEKVLQVLPAALDGWAYRVDASAGSDPWQVIAVDYRPSGAVVYGYARAFTGSETASGGFTKTSGGSPVVCDFVDNSFTVTVDAEGDRAAFWDNGTFLPDVSVDWSAAASSSQSNIGGGLRVGALEITATQTQEFSASADWTFSLGAEGPTSSPQTGGSSLGIDAMPGVSIELDEVAGTRTCLSSSRTTKVEETLYLAYMDLRYDMLFVSVEEHTTVSEAGYDFTDDIALVSHARTTTGTHTTRNVERRRWLTRGWVKGAKVLDDTVTAVDTLDSAATMAALSTFTAPWDNSAYYDLSVGALRLPPVDWTPPDYVAMTYPRDASHTFSVYSTPSNPPPASDAYPQTSTSQPFQQVETWQVEVEPTSGIVGTDTHNAIKVKAHTDLDGVVHVGGWGAYRQGWVASMPLPAINAGGDPFRFYSVAGGRDMAAKVGIPAEHYFPVWVLTTTRGFVT